MNGAPKADVVKRRPGQFPNVTLTIAPDGTPYALVNGKAVMAAQVSVISEEGRAPRLRVEVPMSFVETLSWDDLIARRAETPA